MRSGTELWYVYLLRAKGLAEEEKTGQGSRLYYVGITNNLNSRLKDHNAGKVKSTCGREWERIAYLHMASQRHAAILEKWLKVGDSRQKRERFIALYQAGQHSGIHVEGFTATAIRWYTNRQQKGKVL